jgi:hypothetical protein
VTTKTLKPWRRNCLQNDSEFKETRGKVLAEDFEMQLLSELVYVTASPLPGDTSGKADKEVEEEEEEEGLYLRIETRKRVQTNEAKSR